MDRSYIQWNLPNWITIVLMVTVGTLFVGAISSAVKSAVGAKM